MDARTQYETDGLNTFRSLSRGTETDRASSDSIQSERELFQALQDAVMCLRAVVRNYNAGISHNPQISWQRIADVLSDELPDELAFDERLSAAARGW